MPWSLYLAVGVHIWQCLRRSLQIVSLIEIIFLNEDFLPLGLQ